MLWIRGVNLLLVAAALLCPAAAQSPPSPNAAPPSASGMPAAANAMAPEAAVITIDGLCTGAAPAGSAGQCKTTVTRAQFEKLAQALDANMPRSAYAQLGDSLARIMIMAEAARKRGLADDPKAQEVLRFAQQQVLGQLLSRDLQAASRNIPDAEVEQYYRAHTEQYSQAKLLRLFVPKNPPNVAKKLSDAERFKLMEDARKRAAAGEDFEKLEKELYTALGVTTPPPVDLGAQRRSFLPTDHANVIFAAKPGDVTQVISDSVGEYVYKIVSLDTVPLDAVRNEIKAQLQQQRFQEQFGALFANTKIELNPTYFNSSTTPAGATPAGAGEPQVPQGPRTVKPPL